MEIEEWSQTSSSGRRCSRRNTVLGPLHLCSNLCQIWSIIYFTEIEIEKKKKKSRASHKIPQTFPQTSVLALKFQCLQIYTVYFFWPVRRVCLKVMWVLYTNDCSPLCSFLCCVWVLHKIYTAEGKMKANTKVELSRERKHWWNVQKPAFLFVFNANSMCTTVCWHGCVAALKVAESGKKKQKVKKEKVWRLHCQLMHIQ